MTIIPNGTTRDYAILYWQLGWSVIPIQPGEKLPLGNMPWGEYRQTRSTKRKIEQWFDVESPPSIGIVLGRVSGGLAVRDFDILDAYDAWMFDHQELANLLPTVRTSRGRHVYFRTDPRLIDKLSGRRGTSRLDFVDGELHAGGYVLAPPSVHPSGEDYRWLWNNRSVPFLRDLPGSGLVSAERGRPGAWVDKKPKPTQPTHGLSPLDPPASSAPSCVLCVNPADQMPPSNGSAQRIDSSIEKAITSTLPDGPTRREKMLFNFARALKAIPALANQPAQALREQVREWHRRALPFIGTKEFDETWFAFLRAWDRVKFPSGQSPAAIAIAAVGAMPVPKCAECYESQGVRLLVSICRELQRLSGDAPFFLSSGFAAKQLDVTKTTAWKWLDGLVADGVLQVIEIGTLRGRKATTWRYLGDVNA
jgi:hypothetical protein